MKNRILVICTMLLSTMGIVVHAHDTWVQSGPMVTRYNDVVHVDLMLGNHGNGHRDFKLASKITLAPCSLNVIAPDGSVTDLKPSIKDMGYAEKEGFWSARMVASQKGIYQVVHTLDTLHGKTRAIKSSKSFFISSHCYGTIPTAGLDKINPLNKGLELVLETSLPTVAAGRELQFRVLWNGKPLPDTRVSFVPRGAKLAEEFDPNFERTSDTNGIVQFNPSEGNLLLVVVHHLVEDEKGDGFDKTHYGATLVLSIPQVPFVASP